MKVQLLLGFFIVVVTSSPGDRHYCGRVLSETLNYLCEQEYLVKRSLSVYNRPQSFGNNGQFSFKRPVPSSRIQTTGKELDYSSSSYNGLQGFGNNGEFTLKSFVPSSRMQNYGYLSPSNNALQAYGNNGEFTLKTSVPRSRIQTSGKGHFMKNSMQNPLGLEGYGNSMVSQESWPWFGQQNALSLNSARGKRQGIADECCLKACSIDELLSYC